MHGVEVSTQGKRAWRVQVYAVIGATTVASPPPTPQVGPPGDAEAPAPVAADHQAPGAASSQRTAALVTGAVGAVGVAFGLVAGIVAFAEKSDLVSRCEANGGSFPDRCGGGALDASGREDLRSEMRTASSWAAASTVAWVGGVLGIGVGAALFLTARPSRATVSIGVTPAGAAAVGRW
jgi:hypothetical protein